MKIGVGSDWARFIQCRRDHKSQLKKVDARANLKRLRSNFFSVCVLYASVGFSNESPITPSSAP